MGDPVINFLSSVPPRRDEAKGRGEEGRDDLYEPLSPALSPLVPRGERVTFALYDLFTAGGFTRNS
jgi:hypothetical protein